MRGLKRVMLAIKLGRLQSHPLRVRGLKLEFRTTNEYTISVAPLAGAWIENGELRPGKSLDSVAPLRVRGLKQNKNGFDLSHLVALLRVCGLKPAKT